MNQKIVIVDVEADGEIPHKFSMVCFGAVIVEPSLSRTFYGRTSPISPHFKDDALAISGFTRKEHESFESPESVMKRFNDWIKTECGGSAIFVSDNLAFDWQWINWYMHYFVGSNPFGFSGRRIGDFYAGLKGDWRTPGREWKKLRRTKHTHNPVDDAIGNAEALLTIFGGPVNDQRNSNPAA